MKFYFPVESRQPFAVPLISFKIPAGFPSPAADYVETRIDLNQHLLKNPSFTFFANAEGYSMAPLIQNGDMLVVDRKVDQPIGCVVLASVNNEFCVKTFHKFSDGSIELRPHNPKYASIHLADDFKGQFEIFGRVTYLIHNHLKCEL